VHVSDFVKLIQKKTAVVLADTRDYTKAAKVLRVTVQEVKQQIEALQSTLCLLIFEQEETLPTLTVDGRFLIQRFREALAHRERNHERKSERVALLREEP
jgi:DNA-binding transcriptional LysR family regulator